MSTLPDPAPGTRFRGRVPLRSGDRDHPLAAEPLEAGLELALQSERPNPGGILDLPRHVIGMLGIELPDRKRLQANGPGRGGFGNQLFATPGPGDEEVRPRRLVMDRLAVDHDP